VVQAQTGNLAPTAYSYDSRGRLATVTVGSGASARVTTFGYDSLDRLASVTDPLLRVQSYVYDGANRVVGQVFTDGSEVTFSYDPDGNVASVTPPGRPEHDFGYTPADLMSSYTPPVVPGTGATTYEYNLDKQPTVVQRPDGSQIVTTYDSAGRVATVTYPAGPNTSDGTVTVTRTYNPTTGNLQSVSTSDGQSLVYSYDGSLPLSTTWSGTVAGNVGRTYDNNFRVLSESVNGANSVAFGYDSDGLLTSAGALTLTRDPTNGLTMNATVGTVSDTYRYTSFGELQDKLTQQSGTAIYEENLTRDTDGRIEQKTETIQGVTHTYIYSYDPAGRLWQVMQDGNLTATYLYDANGNRTSKATPSETDTATYDAQDRMLTYGKWNFTYTANGELQTRTDTTTGQVTTYSYDGMGNLRHVLLPDGRTIDYVIDSLNRRAAKKVNGSVVRQWVYSDGLTPAAEFDGSGNLVSRFEGTDYMVQGGTTYRVVKDHLGSPHLIVNATTGVLSQRLDCDEWGNVTISGAQPAGWQPFGFAGGIYDPDTGLARFGSRDYDPVVGRWIQKDPITFAGGELGLFSYAHNDPVDLRDPTGLFTFQCGFTISGSWGPISGTWTVGFAGDTSGNFGWYNSTDFGGGAGAGVSGGVTIATSNANSITDLAGPFGFTTAGAGAGGYASAGGFWGPSGNGPVAGNAVSIGIGGGGGAYTGMSVTFMHTVFGDTGTQNGGGSGPMCGSGGKSGKQ
jgi:RHS repeat-associated protein